MLYLRKANQIHNYIVEKFADGEDKCQEIYLDIEDIKELKEICECIVRKSKLKEDWVYYSPAGYKNYIPDGNVTLAEKKKDGFVKGGECSVNLLNVGDYIYEDEKWANKVEKVELKFVDFFKGNIYQVRYGREGRAQVIKNLELAKELLPTRDGYFFGDTDYNEHYLEDLKEYIRQADEIISDYELEKASGTKDWDIDYYYRASW